MERYFRDPKRAGFGPKSIRQIRAVLHRACRLARSPKNRSSVRNLAIDDDTARSLAELRTRCLQLATATGLDLVPDAFAFSTEPDGAQPATPALS